MQESWFSEEFTLYARITLTPRDWRLGRSREQPALSARASMKESGSPKGLSADTVTVPAKKCSVIVKALFDIKETHLEAGMQHL